MHYASSLSWQLSSSQENFAFFFFCDTSFVIFVFVFVVEGLLKLSSSSLLKGDPVTNTAFPERDVLVCFEGIFFVSGRGVISEGVTNFLHEESSHWRTGADVDKQCEVELLFSMSSFSPSTLTESWIEKSDSRKM
jgi:hypothetical protein